MITLAGVRRAIYNLGKRLEILENNSGGGSGGSSGSGGFSGDYNDLINKPPLPEIWKGTQAQYDALNSYDSNTIYIIS